MPRYPPANANRVASVFVALCWMIAFSASATNSRVVEAFSSTTKRPSRSARFPTSQIRQLPGPRARGHPVSEGNGLRLSENDEEYNPRDEFGRSVRGLRSSALKTVVEVGDTVVCKRSVPNQGIAENASYEVTSIYRQYFDEETQTIVKQPLSSLDDAATGGTTSRADVYITLFSPEYHSEAVIVTPEEVGLATVREELGSAVWLAVPGFFWVAVAASFYNSYHERTGGSFGDAFWGR